ncbi:BTAD domain-containing putative transcriptional regulator [Streptosporangium sp. DT93]|uniref:BTAD domain-containing putative transcriptional regulator n=1 Tax=Streptosporangium sp. DT93 TaxID=3393428 RepID=UPI003CF91DC1
MRFGVLGPLAVWTADGTPVTVPGVKVRTLLAVLLVHEGRPVPADRLIDDLWGESPPGNPAGALSAKVSQLRRVLEDAEPGARETVVSPPPGYVLRAGADAVDAHRFRSLADEADKAGRAGDPRSRAALLTGALALWRGPALADFADEPFARSVITLLNERWLTACEDLAETRLVLGEHHGVVAELGELVGRYPLRERLRAAYMTALYRSGRQSEALDGYEELRAHLADELGLDPGADLVALHRAILVRDPALDPPAAPRDPMAGPATNLPAPLGPLIGRDEATAGIGDLLRTDRLVTLTGPGGVGKTRLAVEVARLRAGDFPDGVWLVELAALGRPGSGDAAGPKDGVDSTAGEVMRVLGVRDTASAGGTPPDHLAGALRPRRLLLVLDNCEHLVDPVAELVEVLLRAAPGLRVLATSQEPLALTGEVVWNVPPLETPAAATDPASLERLGSVRLFVARARAADRGFTLDAATAPAVATLCRRLDGIPLALELAATRVRSLGVTGLAERLDDRFRLLATGHRGAPPRQRTLQAMIDWSWDLLGDPERLVLRRLAVHADGCSLDGAEAVCGADDLPEADVADPLARLVDRSLVTVVHGADGPRYRLLESVSAYCLLRLREAGETARLRERHRRHYTALAEHAAPRLYGHDQQRWLRRLDAENANLQVALDGAVAAGDAEQALRLVNALAWYWFLRGRTGEAERSLAAALAVPALPPGTPTVSPGTPTAPAGAPSVPAGAPSVPAGETPVALGKTSARPDATSADTPAGRAAALRPRVLVWQAGIALLRGRTTDRAAAMRLYEDVGDPAERARAQWFLAFCGMGAGDLALCEDLLDRALTAFDALGDRWGTAATLVARAQYAHVRGDLAALERDSERGAELFDELGDRWGRLQATEWLGGLAEMTGDHERAERLQDEGLRMAEELELWPEVAGRLAWLGWIALQRGDHARARTCGERAARLAAEQCHRSTQIFAETVLGYAARKEGRFDAATTHLRTVLAWTPRRDDGTDHAMHEPMILAELGFVAEQLGDAEAARALHLEGLTVARGLDASRDVTRALEGLAGALSLAGSHDRAARLLGAAAAARRSTAMPPAPAEQDDVDRITDRVRDALGEDGLAAGLERGGGLAPGEIESLAGPPVVT